MSFFSILDFYTCKQISYNLNKEIRVENYKKQTNRNHKYIFEEFFFKITNKTKRFSEDSVGIQDIFASLSRSLYETNSITMRLEFCNGGVPFLHLPQQFLPIF